MNAWILVEGKVVQQVLIARTMVSKMLVVLHPTKEGQFPRDPIFFGQTPVFLEGPWSGDSETVGEIEKGVRFFLREPFSQWKQATRRKSPQWPNVAGTKFWLLFAYTYLFGTGIMWKNWPDSNLAFLGPFLLVSMWEVDSDKTQPSFQSALVHNKENAIVSGYWKNWDGVYNKKKISTFFPVNFLFFYSTGRKGTGQLSEVLYQFWHMSLITEIYEFKYMT